MIKIQNIRSNSKGIPKVLAYPHPKNTSKIRKIPYTFEYILLNTSHNTRNRSYSPFKHKTLTIIPTSIKTLLNRKIRLQNKKTNKIQKPTGAYKVEKNINKKGKGRRYVKTITDIHKKPFSLY